MFRKFVEKYIFTIFLIMWSFSALIRKGFTSQGLLIFSLALLMLFTDLYFNLKTSKIEGDDNKLKIKHSSSLVTKYFFFPLFFIAFIYYVHTTAAGASYIVKIAADVTGLIIFALTYYYSDLKNIRFKKIVK